MRFVFSLVLFFSASAALAACPGQSQLEMNDCAVSRYQQADGQLNAVWPQAKGYMDGLGAGELLLDAQRKWLAFRDATCSAEIAPFAGGSIQPLVWYECLIRVTQTRTNELYALISP